MTDGCEDFALAQAVVSGIYASNNVIDGFMASGQSLVDHIVLSSLLRAPTTLCLRHAERSQGRLLLLLSQSIQAGKKDGEEVVRLGQHPTVSDPK